MKQWILLLVILTGVQFTKANAQAQSKDSTEKVTRVQQKAEFKGGNDELMRYIGKKFKFPKYYWEERKGFNAVILVQFTITKKGCVEDVSILNPHEVPEDLQEIAIKVVQKMNCNKWNPALQQETPVNQRFQLPIHVVVPNT